MTAGTARAVAFLAASVTASLVAATLLGAPVAGATTGPGSVARRAAPLPAPPPGRGLSPEVAALPASSPELDAAQATRTTRAATLVRNQLDLERTADGLDRTEIEGAGVTGLAARRVEQVAKAQTELARARAALSALAAEWFVTGLGSVRSLDPTLTASQLQDLGRQQVLAETATAGAVDGERFVAERLRRLTAQRDDLTRRRAALEERTTTLTGRRDRLTAAVRQGQVDLVAADQQVEAARLNATIDGTDMSTIALDAYWRAANTMQLSDPRCGMTWWALAGIGRTESAHGTYQGRELGLDGRVSEPIFGPPLDGTNGFAVVADSDRGLLDAVATSDRAVGPMQFLPGTWRTVGRDATGDGVADPQNLYDAALAAAVYMCRAGAVSDDAGLRRAYLSYNRSASYVDLVVQRATDYRTVVPLPSTA